MIVLTFTIIYIFVITRNLEVFNDHVGPNNHFHDNAKKMPERLPETNQVARDSEDLTT